MPAESADFAYISCGTWSLVGVELDAPVLTEASLADVEAAAGARVAEGNGRVRAGEVDVEPGYDGRFGTVHVFPPA